MAGATLHRRGPAPFLLALLTAAAGLSAPPALAADTIFWANFSGNTIGMAGLDGSGGADLPTAGAPAVASPSGVAIDAAAGRIYWTDSDGPISYASLDGSGAGGELETTGAATASVRGLAIDPAAGRLYWVNQGAPAAEAIAYANLDGSGGGALSTEGASTPSGPDGLAIDPAANRIYWANQGTDKISYANLDGSGGGGDLNTTGATVDTPTGLALDPASNRLFVTNFNGAVSYVNLDGSGGGDLSVSPLTPGSPYGAAIDPVSGRIYFVDDAGAVDSASLGGGGGETLDTLGATAGDWLFPAILERPSATGAPAVGGGSTPGSTLSCAPGSWAGDLLGSSLYRAPRGFAYQWNRDGADIPGATSSTVAASSAGDYRCRVTATNDAGSASQTSDPFRVAAPALPTRPAPPPLAPPSNLFRLRKARLNEKKGTASLPVRVPGPGLVRLRVAGTASRHRARTSAADFVGAAGTVRLPVVASGKIQKKLDRRGRAKVRVKVTFTPNGGTAATKTKSLTLVKRRPR
jgi:hypothetical protein